MKNVLFVALGGFLGTSLRYYLSFKFSAFKQPFPLGILIINLIGSFLIGVLAAIGLDHPNYQYVLITGGLGAFTTFSTFSLEAVSLLTNKKMIHFVSYILVSVLGAVILCYMGFHLVNIIYL